MATKKSAGRKSAKKVSAKRTPKKRVLAKKAAPAASTSGLVPREYLEPLQAAWRERRLVLFLGAGVSAPYGLANWTDLVLDLLLGESRKFQRFWPHYRKALALWMTDYYDFSPLALARVVKYKLRRSAVELTDAARHGEFLELVRETLYQTFNEGTFKEQPFNGKPYKATALKTIAKLAARDQTSKDGRHIPLIFTTNFDNVLELELQKAGVEARPVYDAKRRRDDKLPVVHVHGYLPREGPIPQLDLVFTEDEYHKLSYSAFHWALSDIVNCFRNYTVLFVGLSMSDPNLRRLLDATYVSSDGLVHYLLRKEYEIAPAERVKAIRIIDDYAQEQGRRVGLNEVKSESSVSDAIDTMLRQASEYDRDLFRDMGLGTIWFKDYDDIPKILSEIAG
jgi:hypothetical protein